MTSKQLTPTIDDPLFSGPRVRAELGDGKRPISNATFWRWRKSGKIPPPVDLPGAPRWRRSTILAIKGVAA